MRALRRHHAKRIKAKEKTIHEIHVSKFPYSPREYARSQNDYRARGSYSSIQYRYVLPQKRKLKADQYLFDLEMKAAEQIKAEIYLLLDWHREFRE